MSAHPYTVTDPDTGKVWPIPAGGSDDDPAPADDQPDDTPSGDDVDWQAEAEKWKSLSRKHENQAKSNADKAMKFDELQEAQKSEQEKLTEAKEAAAKEAAEAKRDAARLRVALSKGLTESQAKRLVGDTVEELEVDADELLESFQQDDQPPAPDRKPREKLRSGAVADAEPEETDPAALASAIRESSYGGRL